MPVINRIYANTYTFFDATLLTLTFQLCDPGIPEACFLLKILNTSDVNVHISYDGTTGHDVILANSEIILPFQENSRSSENVSYLSRGTPVYVATETVAGISGYIYIISYYQPLI